MSTYIGPSGGSGGTASTAVQPRERVLETFQRDLTSTLDRLLSNTERLQSMVDRCYGPSPRAVAKEIGSGGSAGFVDEMGAIAERLRHCMSSQGELLDRL